MAWVMTGRCWCARQVWHAGHHQFRNRRAADSGATGVSPFPFRCGVFLKAAPMLPSCRDHAAPYQRGLLRAWSLGPTAPLGYAAGAVGTQRMNQQIRPETLQILKVNPSPSRSSAAPPGLTPRPPHPAPLLPGHRRQRLPHVSTPAGEAPANRAAKCLQAGVFDDRQAEALRTAAAGCPPAAGRWSPRPSQAAGWSTWGGFDDIETLDRKRAELRAR